MKTRDDVERYLGLTGHAYELVEADTWLVTLPPDLKLAVRFQAPILEMRMRVMNVPAQGREEFFATLLRLNATAVVHGAFALEGDHVLLECALQVENLDLNELQAALDSFDMTINQARDVLARWS